MAACRVLGSRGSDSRAAVFRGVGFRDVARPLAAFRRFGARRLVVRHPVVEQVVIVGRGATVVLAAEAETIAARAGAGRRIADVAVGAVRAANRAAIRVASHAGRAVAVMVAMVTIAAAHTTLGLL